MLNIVINLSTVLNYYYYKISYTKKNILKEKNSFGTGGV